MASSKYWADEVAELSKLALQLGTTFESGESVSSDFVDMNRKLLNLTGCLDRLLETSNRNAVVFDGTQGRDSLVKIIEDCKKTLYKVRTIVDKYSDKLEVDGKAWKKYVAKGWRKVDFTSKSGAMREVKAELDKHCGAINLVVHVLTIKPQADTGPAIVELDSQALNALNPRMSIATVSSSSGSIPSRRMSIQTIPQFAPGTVPANYNIFNGFPRVFADLITDAKKLTKRTFHVLSRNSSNLQCPEAMINPNLYSSKFQINVEPLFYCRCFNAGGLRAGIHHGFTSTIKCGPSTIIVLNESPHTRAAGQTSKEYVLCQPGLNDSENIYDYEKNPVIIKIPNNKGQAQTLFEGTIVQVLALKAARSLCENRMLENKWVRWEKDRIYEREHRGRVLVASAMRLHLDREDALSLRYLAPDTMQTWPHDLGVEAMTIVDYRSVEKPNLYTSIISKENLWEDSESVMLHVVFEDNPNLTVKRTLHCEYLGKEPKLTGSVLTCEISSLIHFENSKPIISEATVPAILNTINISAGEKGTVFLDQNNQPVPSLETAVKSQEAGKFSLLLEQVGQRMAESWATRRSRHEDVVSLFILNNITIFGNNTNARTDFYESTLALLRNRLRNSSRLVARGKSGLVLSQTVAAENSNITADLNENNDDLAVSNSSAIFATLRRSKDGETISYEHESKPILYHFRDKEEAVTCQFKIADPNVDELLPENIIREEAMANRNLERIPSRHSHSGSNGLNLFYSELPGSFPGVASPTDAPAEVIAELPAVLSLPVDVRTTPSPRRSSPSASSPRLPSVPEGVQQTLGHRQSSVGFDERIQFTDPRFDGHSTPPLIPPPRPGKPDFYNELENMRRRLAQVKFEISLNEDPNSVFCSCAVVHPGLITPAGSMETATPQLLICACDGQGTAPKHDLRDYRAGPFTLAIQALGNKFTRRPGCFVLMNVVAKTVIGQELYLRSQSPEDENVVGDALGSFLRLRASRSIHVGISSADHVPVSIEDEEKISLLSSFGNLVVSPEVYFRKEGEREWNRLSRRVLGGLSLSNYVSTLRSAIIDQNAIRLKGDALHDGKPILRMRIDDLTEFSALVESAPKWHVEYESSITYTVMMDVSRAIESVSDEEHREMASGKLKFMYKGFYPKEKVAQKDAFQTLAWFEFWKCRMDISSLYQLGNNEEEVFSIEIEALRVEMEHTRYFDGIFDHSSMAIVQDQELNRLRLVSKEPRGNWILIQEVLLGTFPLDSSKTSQTAINHSAVGSRMFRLNQPETLIADPTSQMCWRIAGGCQYTFRSSSDRDRFCQSLARAADFMETLEEEHMKTFVEDPHLTETVELFEQTTLDHSMPSLLRRSTMPRVNVHSPPASTPSPTLPSPYSSSSTASKNAALQPISIPAPPPLPIPPVGLLGPRPHAMVISRERASISSPVSAVSPTDTSIMLGPAIYKVTKRHVAKQSQELDVFVGEIIRTESEDSPNSEWVYGRKRGITSNQMRHSQTMIAGWVPRECLRRQRNDEFAGNDGDLYSAH